MSELRYSGQEAEVGLVNATTQDQLIPTILLASLKASFPFELKKDSFIGLTGPSYREFADGYELELEFQPDVAADFVTLHNAQKAKAEGKSTDEFVAAFTLKSPDEQAWRVVFQDLHFEEALGIDLGGQQDFVKSTVKAKGRKYKVALQ